MFTDAAASGSASAHKEGLRPKNLSRASLPPPSPKTSSLGWRMVQSPGELRQRSSWLVSSQPDFDLRGKKKSHCPLASSTKGHSTKGLGLSLKTEDSRPEEGTRTLLWTQLFVLDGMAQ